MFTFVDAEQQPKIILANNAPPFPSVLTLIGFPVLSRFWCVIVRRRVISSFGIEVIESTMAKTRTVTNTRANATEGSPVDYNSSTFEFDEVAAEESQIGFRAGPTYQATEVYNEEELPPLELRDPNHSDSEDEDDDDDGSRTSAE